MHLYLESLQMLFPEASQQISRKDLQWISLAPSLLFSQPDPKEIINSTFQATTLS